MSMRRLVNIIQERIRNVEGRARLNRFLVHFCPSALPLTHQASPLLATLEEEGNVFLPPLTEIEELHALQATLAEMPCYDPWHPERGDFLVADTPAETNNARIRNVEQLPAARALANHPLVLSIVSNYLGCRPTIDDILAWWSLPGRLAPKEEQFFHRDNDAVRFVKLFIYLGDVEEDEGAHVFISGSHCDNLLLERRRRYRDEEVMSAFGDNRAHKMAGAFGCAFLEDTFGLHKGAVPATKPRLLFQVRYTSYPSVFARAEAVLRNEDKHDPYINRYVA